MIIKLIKWFNFKKSVGGGYLDFTPIYKKGM